MNWFYKRLVLTIVRHRDKRQLGSGVIMQAATRSIMTLILGENGKESVTIFGERCKQGKQSYQ